MSDKKKTIVTLKIELSKKSAKRFDNNRLFYPRLCIAIGDILRTHLTDNEYATCWRFD
jgi:hypothetical protein